MDNKMTKKKVILIKIKNLQTKLKEFLKPDKELFGSIEDIDIADFLFYFNFLFPLNSNYQELLTTLIMNNDVLLDQTYLNQVVELTLPFIIWLRKLK